MDLSNNILLMHISKLRYKYDKYKGQDKVKFEEFFENVLEDSAASGGR